MADDDSSPYRDTTIPMENMDGNTSDTQDGLLGSKPSVSHFTLDVKELRELMENRGLEAVEVIKDKYGGVKNICKKLYTSENEGIVSLTFTASAAYSSY
jgi:hypothetical protein